MVYIVLTEVLHSNGFFYNAKFTNNKCFYTGNNKVISFKVNSSISNKIDSQYIIDKGDKFEVIIKNL
jgi:hypothetical protein